MRYNEKFTATELRASLQPTVIFHRKEHRHAIRVHHRHHMQQQQQPQQQQTKTNVTRLLVECVFGGEFALHNILFIGEWWLGEHLKVSEILDATDIESQHLNTVRSRTPVLRTTTIATSSLNNKNHERRDIVVRGWGGTAGVVIFDSTVKEPQKT
ncbi:hypothetical protein V9T40_008605 [Parthenolecanium corni]|uniref:Uncharacterized protein n=1 Tax=Parthenolecanium corni TaxID=536013 RepID=A0AAN9TL68_9HEMI